MNARCAKLGRKRQLLPCAPLEPSTRREFGGFLQRSQQLLSGFCVKGSQTSLAAAEAAGDWLAEPAGRVRCSSLPLWCDVLLFLERSLERKIQSCPFCQTSVALELSGISYW